MKKIKNILVFIFVFVFISNTKTFGSFDKKTEIVKMPDGIKLATDIYLPKTKKNIPVILMRTPYGREGMVSMLLPFLDGKNIAFVSQDVRGRFGSEGLSNSFLEKAIETGLEKYIYTPDISPETKTAHTKIYLNKENASYITLPIIKK